MKSAILLLALVLVACGSDEKDPQQPTPPSVPPFEGTIWLDPDIITDTDPTVFADLTPAGTGTRTMFDRRAADWVTLDDVYLYNATYSDGLAIEVQVNPEFTETQAEVEALKYATVVGRLPKGLRKDVETMWIHQGVQPYGGGNNNILIHTGQTEVYERQGVLEETLVHEASHTSLDAEHARSAGWLEAQEKDPTFISTYARDNPEREDVAETFLLFLAVTLRADRISDELKEEIEETIPHRIAYFAAQDIEMSPVE